MWEGERKARSRRRLRYILGGQRKRPGDPSANIMCFNDAVRAICRDVDRLVQILVMYLFFVNSVELDLARVVSKFSFCLWWSRYLRQVRYSVWFRRKLGAGAFLSERAELRSVVIVRRSRGTSPSARADAWGRQAGGAE